MKHFVYTRHTYSLFNKDKVWKSKNGNSTAILSFNILVSLGCHNKYLKIDSFCTFFP